MTLLRQAQVSSVHLMSAAFVVDVSQLEVYWRTMVTLLRQAQASSVHLMSGLYWYMLADSDVLDINEGSLLPKMSVDVAATAQVKAADASVTDSVTR